MVEKLFVPYEIAKIAKEKGFDESVIATFDYKNELKLREVKTTECLKAPTYQQLVDWFREKHNLVVESRPLNNLNWWDAYIWNGDTMDRILRVPGFKTYYEALNKAIEESFKLIKL